MNNQVYLQYIEELRSICNSDVYIYGAGIVGKRLYSVIKNISCEKNVKGYIISQKKDEKEIDGIRIFSLDEITNKKNKILIAVSDMHQNEILNLLKIKGFNNVTNGYVYSLLNEDNFSNNIPLEVPRDILINVDELMSMQFDKGQFVRYDILVELINIKEENQIKKKNFDKIIVDKNMKICEDAKKIAHILFNNVTDINIHQQFDYMANIFDYKWFTENVLEDTRSDIEELLNYKIKKWKQPFVGILWSTAQEFFDDIIKSIESYAEIENYFDIKMSNLEIEKFIREIYTIDDVESQYIEKKIARINEIEKKKIRIVTFYLEEPDFKIKRYGHSISNYSIFMKREIRDKYKEKIENYIHDIIIHTTDNYTQTKKVMEIIERFR